MPDDCPATRAERIELFAGNQQPALTLIREEFFAPQAVVDHRLCKQENSDEVIERLALMEAPLTNLEWKAKA